MKSTQRASSGSKHAEDFEEQLFADACYFRADAGSTSIVRFSEMHGKEELETRLRKLQRMMRHLGTRSRRVPSSTCDVLSPKSQALQGCFLSCFLSRRSASGTWPSSTTHASRSLLWLTIVCLPPVARPSRSYSTCATGAHALQTHLWRVRPVLWVTDVAYCSSRTSTRWSTMHTTYREGVQYLQAQAGKARHAQADRHRTCATPSQEEEGRREQGGREQGWWQCRRTSSAGNRDTGT